MITRKQYMDKEATHAEFFRQFVTPAVLRMVEKRIGLDQIRASTDEHLNDIPLRRWDVLEYETRLLCYKACKEAGEGWSLSTNTCITKQAARMLLEREVANRSAIQKAEGEL